MLNKVARLSFWSALCFIITLPAMAHGVAEQDQGFLAGAAGTHLIPYLYLGAKHMVTGYDHLLYLAGVIFFLGKLKDVVVYVSLFAIGHSLTLLAGVLSGIYINPYLIDAIIGLSVCYKALENLGTVQFLNPKFMVFAFGLAHGFGLSSKLQDVSLSRDGLIANMLAFNLGVEVGQVIALALLFWLFTWLRNQNNFAAIAKTTNILLFCAGLMLFGFQSVGYFLL
ncbi:HupE/UreJ family protein [Paraglaciecola marina]|uniref:HupE/UreJ family protein n=1 Tax=Paraglaciecola marina TaxID=2500157 RepID=UPI001060BBA6|nr:HupE/UreJ family protein [Paraglaciecola marina]